MRETLVKTEEFKDSAVGKIPNDWEVYTLGECVRPDAPITYGIVQAGSHVEGGVPYIRTGDMAGDRLSLEGLLRTSPQIAASYRRSEVRTGEIVCAIRATVGKVLEVPPELDGANLTQGTARIACRENINNHFLLWALRSNYAQRQFDLAVKGTTFSEITLENLRKIYVALPSSRDEQDTIAEILDTVDKAIARTSSLIAKLKQMKAGLLHDLLTRGLDENGELRDAIAHPEQFKESPLGQMPKDWQVIKLGSVTDIENGTTPSREEPRLWSEGTIPWLATGKVHDRFIYQADEFITKYALRVCSLRLLPIGTILVAMIGQGLTRGKVAYLAFEASINQNFGAILPCSSFDSRFLFHYLDFNYEYVRGSSRGSNQQALNCAVIAGLEVICPPKEEQKAIAASIDVYDTRIRSEEAYCEKLKLQKQGLMHDLLTGKVRVKNA